MIDFYETLKVLSDKESRILMRLPWVTKLSFAPLKRGTANLEAYTPSWGRKN
jgi:hypothetical protein